MANKEISPHILSYLIFGVLSLNAQSLFTKFDGLIAMLELFGYQRIHFPIICIQETWITDESKMPLVSIEGYNCYYVKPTASSNGSLITYVDNSFEVTVIKKIDFSTVWEGLFLELKHGSLKNKFVIGNIYIYIYTCIYIYIAPERYTTYYMVSYISVWYHIFRCKAPVR